MTPTMSTWCSNQLSYNPKRNVITIAQIPTKCKGANYKKIFFSKNKVA